MKIHRFITKYRVKENNLVSIREREVIHQIIRVLHLKKGEKIILLDGFGEELFCDISEIKKDKISLMILDRKEGVLVNKNKTILFVSIVKRENFELIAQKAGELGVTEVYPVIADRTVKLGFKKERVEKIMKEASELAGRASIPILKNQISFLEALNIAENNQQNVFFDIGGLPDKKIRKAAESIGIFIGPEGGWSKEELEKIALKKNFLKISLGKYTLRAETAAIIGMYLVG